MKGCQLFFEGHQQLKKDRIMKLKEDTRQFRKNVFITKTKDDSDETKTTRRNTNSRKRRTELKEQKKLITVKLKGRRQKNKRTR